MALRQSTGNVENIAPTSRGGRTVEETYTKLSQLEHVLVRPDTYVGSVERMQQTTWVWDQSQKCMVYKEISYAPGLYKIFDEIIVNAADHAQRDKNTDCIKVEIDPENQLISVWNNGAGIPVEIHKKEKMYVPELIFGHLLTSSNYNDNEKKVVGGRNGFGAKLANIFSTEFIVETADAVNGKRYKQVFRDNMSSKDDPVVRSNPKNEAFTKISFSPDLKRFGMTHLDDDIISLLMKRVYDIAGVNSSIKVHLNGSKINIKSFKDYIALYPNESGNAVAHERLDDRWEVAISASDGQLSQVSFVNSIWTIKGGTHVAHVADAIVAKIIEHIAKKDKGLSLKPFQVKNHLSLFINCLIENPSFDSQTKETLTTKPTKFGSKWSFSDELAKKVVKSNVIDNILAFARFKQEKELSKTDGGKKARLVGITKLEDANKAGGREASRCTLILTEGDSAKALAISGLSVVGRDYYGVFPLKGKLLNVREAKHKQIMDNAEINNLKKILGLQHNKTYDAESVKSLRYGHVLIMADQDHDGSHIKGLVINFFDHFWPSLLQIPGFIQEFITPIVKCVKGNNNRVFFTVPQYKNWASSAEGAQRGWKPKYYKGLGTSTAAEAKGYFSNLPVHLHKFKHVGDQDSDMIELAFSKNRVGDRKDWLAAYEPGTFFDHESDELNYSNFVNKELILFSIADNERSIPSIIDGMKPSQRKVLYACFKRKLTKNEIKVAQLAGYISEHAAYHHGEMSLQSTIVGLAQNFVGSNNLNLLVPAGQFGTRLLGGKDAASSRYIFTKLAPITRALIPEADDPLLSYLEEEGQKIEPKWYCPIIPLVLVNGSEGIGTGWSSSIPCYNPRDLIRNVRHLLNGEPVEEMSPWYRGFQGAIVPVENAKTFDVYGTLLRGRDANTFKITELPIRSWTTTYKEFLESSIIGNSEAKAAFIKEFQDNGTENKVNFTLTTSPEHASMLMTNAGYKRLKLSTSISTNNMVLFDAEGRIRRYDSPEEILKEFFQVRLELYYERRAYLLHELEKDLLCLDNKQRFILMVVEGKLIVAKRKKAELISELENLKFDPIYKKSTGTQKAEDNESEGEKEETENDASDLSERDSGFDYLLSMPLWSLTIERVRQLAALRDSKEGQKCAMENTSSETLWESDLKNLEIALVKDEELAQSLAEDLERVAKAARSKQRRGGGKRKGGKPVVYDEEDDGDNELEMVPLPSTRVVVPKVPREKKTTVSKPKSDRTMKASATTKQNATKRTKLVESSDGSGSGSDHNEYSEYSDDDLNVMEENRNDGGLSDGLAEMTLGAGQAKRGARDRRGMKRRSASSSRGTSKEEPKEEDDADAVLNLVADEDEKKEQCMAGTASLSNNDVFSIPDDEDEIIPIIATPTRGRKKATVRGGPSASLNPKSNLKAMSSSEDELGLSERLAQRLKVRSLVSEVPNSTAASTASPVASTAELDEDGSPEVTKVTAKAVSKGKKKTTGAVKRGARKAKKPGNSEALELSPGKSPAAKKMRVKSPVQAGLKKRGRPSKKAPKAGTGMELSMEEGSQNSIDSAVVEIPPAQAVQEKRERIARKLLDNDGDDEYNDIVEVPEVSAEPVVSKRGRPRRAAARKIIIEENSEDSENGDGSVEFGDDDDDEDFE